MKHILTLRWIKPAALALLVVVIGLSAIGIAIVPVFAQTGSGTPQPGTPNATGVAVLEKAFTNENTWLTTQANNLQKIDQLVTKAQGLIDKANGKGWNVVKLQAVLDAFKAQIADAQKGHEAAAVILASHAGFDAAGVVTDKTAAILTVKNARQSLMDGRVLLRQAVVDLRAEIRAFRSAHQNGSQPATPTATPAGSGS